MRVDSFTDFTTSGKLSIFPPKIPLRKKTFHHGKSG